MRKSGLQFENDLTAQRQCRMTVPPWLLLAEAELLLPVHLVDEHPLPVDEVPEVDLGFGRIVASEREAPIIFVSLV